MTICFIIGRRVWCGIFKDRKVKGDVLLWRGILNSVWDSQGPRGKAGLVGVCVVTTKGWYWSIFIRPQVSDSNEAMRVNCFLFMSHLLYKATRQTLSFGSQTRPRELGSSIICLMKQIFVVLYSSGLLKSLLRN